MPAPRRAVLCLPVPVAVFTRAAASERHVRGVRRELRPFGLRTRQSSGTHNNVRDTAYNVRKRWPSSYQGASRHQALLLPKPVPVAVVPTFYYTVALSVSHYLAMSTMYFPLCDGVLICWFVRQRRSSAVFWVPRMNFIFAPCAFGGLCEPLEDGYSCKYLEMKPIV